MVGDKAVHPAHGVGEVTGIEEREIGGTRAKFYILRILDNGMKVMVPTSAATQVGLRYVMSDKEATSILSTMRAREVAVDVQPWSRRFRVYTEMIKSGSPIEIAKVLRDMNRLKFDKELSFGERRLLDQAKSLLLKELVDREEEDRGRDVRGDRAGSSARERRPARGRHRHDHDFDGRRDGSERRRDRLDVEVLRPAPAQAGERLVRRAPLARAVDLFALGNPQLGICVRTADTFISANT